MRVVIIADNLGENAPGIVFRNILEKLYDKLDFDLITSTFTYKHHPNHRGNLIKINQTRIKSWRIRTWLFKFFGYYHTQKKWAQKVQHILNENDYDVVISFMSSTFYASVMAAAYFSYAKQVKHICYCVDAVPAPFPWETDKAYSDAMKKFVRNYMRSVNVLCMTNKEMLDYEVSIINSSSIARVVLPNPPQKDTLQYLNFKRIEPYFVYAGKLYGIRTPDALIRGFILFLKKCPNAKLIFVGSGKLEDYIRANFQQVIANIVFLPYTSDLSSIYHQCIGLIDVNANIDNDVFLSSKIISYLPYNRLIISESGNGSPVRSVFGQSSTIIHVHHDPIDYLKAMDFCYNNYDNIDFSERVSYLSSMSSEAGTIKMMNCIMNK